MLLGPVNQPAVMNGDVVSTGPYDRALLQDSAKLWPGSVRALQNFLHLATICSEPGHSAE